MRYILTPAVLITLSGAAAQAGCVQSDEACTLDGGTYHIALPETVSNDAPAVVWLHGAGGSGAGAMRNTGMMKQILDRGYAFIAVDGLDRPGPRGTGWNFIPRLEWNRDEVSFLNDVADDAAERFELNRDDMILAGFSIGGSMTSYLACAEPESFAAYAPVAGSFWKPEPESCAGSVKLFHTHGWRDQTVPLEGRPLRNGEIYQGDVWTAMQVWRTENACDLLRPDSFIMKDGFWRRKWESCAPETALEFALHAGGHGIPQGWSGMVLDWYEQLED